jgi:hypothetical protein
VGGKIFGAFKLGLLVVIALLLVGLAIPTTNPMPGFATVYLDDLSRTYLAQPCMQVWKSRPGSGVVHASSARYAWSLSYLPDKVCQQSGAFAGSDSSVTRDILVNLGILRPPRQWWDTIAHPKAEIARSNPE